MEYINPDSYDRPILGPDGSVYQQLNGTWNKIFTCSMWGSYVKKHYYNYILGSVDINTLLDKLTNIEIYKELSGYSGDLVENMFKFIQYDSIYHMYFLLTILSAHNLDIEKIINVDPINLKKNVGYEKNLINTLKAEEYEYILPSENVSYGLYKYEIIKPNQISDVINNIVLPNVNNPKEYFYDVCQTDSLSDDNRHILIEKHSKFIYKLREKLSLFNLSETIFDKIVARFTKEIDVKIRYNPETNGFDEDDILWDHDDLIFGDDNCIYIFFVPYHCLPPDDQYFYLKYAHEQVIKKINDILNIKDIRSAIKYSMKYGDMWCQIPFIFNQIFDENLEQETETLGQFGQSKDMKNKEIIKIQASRTEDKRKKINHDWSTNYKIGAQIFIMIRNNITPYVNDFCCLNI